MTFDDDHDEIVPVFSSPAEEDVREVEDHTSRTTLVDEEIHTRKAVDETDDPLYIMSQVRSIWRDQ